MRWWILSSAFLGLRAFVTAQTATFDPITSPTLNQEVAAGSSLEILWEPSASYSGTIMIQLLQGATTATLSKGVTIASAIDNAVGKYIWTIPTTIASFAVYGLEISLDSDTTVFSYSFPFHITKSNTTPSSTSSPDSITLSSPKASTPSPSVTPTVPADQTSSSLAVPTQGSSSSSSGQLSFTGGSPLSSTSSPSSATNTPLLGASQSSSSSSLPTSTGTAHQGLTTGAKAGIGVGAALGACLVLGLVGLAFWYGQRFANRKSKVGDNVETAELGAGKPSGAELATGELLNGEEKAELESRRRAAELEGNVPHGPIEVGAGDRAELESRRKLAKDMFELQ